ncbi:MAG: cache type 2 domain-containing protein [Deltaproteobacteria bacterium HGW-Deltaproteobacteria-15]|jgi:signal transduction histidine kinase|nr:MAG: cache type 2 domain-containing protein [Deltaproteobacteria bacterium HGW-Deltaproteobacteria-15]
MKKMIIVLAVIGLLAGFAHASDKDAAKALVEEAVTYVNSQGKDKALAEISKAKGAFDKGELYVFAYDLDARVIAHPKNPKLIGKNLAEVPDNDGKLFRKEIVEIAKTKGTGWVDYKYMNPETKKPEPKTTYLQKVGDIIVCCGTYK